MILYLDTSALVKTTLRKPEALMSGKMSNKLKVLRHRELPIAEARAAFARKRREQGLSRADYRSVVNDLDEDWGDYFIVDVSKVWFGPRVFWPRIML